MKNLISQTTKSPNEDINLLIKDVNKNIIARISMDKTNYGFGKIMPANRLNGLLLSDVRKYSGKVDLQKLNFQLLNEIGNPISLNGSDYSLCLEIEHE